MELPTLIRDPFEPACAYAKEPVDVAQAQKRSGTVAWLDNNDGIIASNRESWEPVRARTGAGGSSAYCVRPSLRRSSSVLRSFIEPKGKDCRPDALGPVAVINKVWPRLFFTSSLAPFSTRNWMTVLNP